MKPKLYRKLAWARWWPFWSSPLGHPEDWSDKDFIRMYPPGEFSA